MTRRSTQISTNTNQLEPDAEKANQLARSHRMTMQFKNNNQIVKQFSLSKEIARNSSQGLYLQRAMSKNSTLENDNTFTEPVLSVNFTSNDAGE